MHESSIADFSQSVYTRGNIAIVADGTTQASLSKWVEPFFRDVPVKAEAGLPLYNEASKYYGGEQRVSMSGSNAMVIGFPGSNLNADKADIAVLAALLGGESSIKWSPGFSLFSKASAAAKGATIVAKNLAYTDAGLLTIQITGSAASVRVGAQEAVKALKSVAESGINAEVLAKAKAKAKFDLLSVNELTGNGIVSAGNSLIHGGKIFQVSEALKSYESVTSDKIKAVSYDDPYMLPSTCTNQLLSRRQRRCWMVGRLWQQRETCTFSHSRRRSASRHRILVYYYKHHGGKRKMYNSSNRFRGATLWEYSTFLDMHSKIYFVDKTRSESDDQ